MTSVTVQANCAGNSPGIQRRNPPPPASWGLNTIANWSDESTRLLRRTPYTDAVQIGFVDIADTPYCETIEASREVGRKLYRSRQ